MYKGFSVISEWNDFRISRVNRMKNDIFKFIVFLSININTLNTTLQPACRLHLFGQKFNNNYLCE